MGQEKDRNSVSAEVTFEKNEQRKFCDEDFKYYGWVKSLLMQSFI